LSRIFNYSLLTQARLPDGIVTYQKTHIERPIRQFWPILWTFGVIYGHLVYSMTIRYILWPFDIFYDHLVYSMTIWYILWPFGTFFMFWYVVPPKNLATLAVSRNVDYRSESGESWHQNDINKVWHIKW
jgi:hypothetical protein